MCVYIIYIQNIQYPWEVFKFNPSFWCSLCCSSLVFCLHDNYCLSFLFLIFFGSYVCLSMFIYFWSFLVSSVFLKDYFTYCSVTLEYDYTSSFVTSCQQISSIVILYTWYDISCQIQENCEFIQLANIVLNVKYLTEHYVVPFIFQFFIKKKERNMTCPSKNM